MKRILSAIFLLSVGLSLTAQTASERQLVESALSWLKPYNCVEQPSFTHNAELCQKRLAALPFAVEMTYNPVVCRFIDLYLAHPKEVAAMKSLLQTYTPLLEEILVTQELPLELAYLAAVESGFNASAVARNGAAGLWQLQPSVAKAYGLEVNSVVDERLENRKATMAAAMHLNSLYRIYGDWQLVISSYNCGPGNVNKAIHRAGGKKNFWDIYPYLPEDTRNYVPCFIAAAYVLTYTEGTVCTETGSADTLEQSRIAVDTLFVDHRQHLIQTSEVLRFSIDSLRRLNPQYRRDIIPGGKSYPLVLPLSLIGDYLDMQDDILAYKADQLVNNRLAQVEIPQPEPSASDSKKKTPATTGKAKTYTVKKGDTLSGIATKYKCSVADLRKWNRINGSRITVGQTLKVSR